MIIFNRIDKYKSVKTINLSLQFDKDKTDCYIIL